MTKSLRTFSRYIVGAFAVLALGFQTTNALAQQPIKVLVVLTDDAKEEIETSPIFGVDYDNDIAQFVDGLFTQANNVLVENFQNYMLTLPAVLEPVGTVWDLNTNLGADFDEHAYTNHSAIVQDIQENMSSFMIGSATIEAVRQAYQADLVLVVNLRGIDSQIAAAGLASPSNNFHPNVATLDALRAGSPFFSLSAFRRVLIHEVLHLLGLDHDDGVIDHNNHTCDVMVPGADCPENFTVTTVINLIWTLTDPTGLLRLASLFENGTPVFGGGGGGGYSGGGGIPPDPPGPVWISAYVHSCTDGVYIAAPDFYSPPPLSNYSIHLSGDANSAEYEVVITLAAYSINERFWGYEDDWGVTLGPGPHDLAISWPGDILVSARAFNWAGTPGPWEQVYVAAQCFEYDEIGF